MVINENEYSFSLSKRDRDDLLLSRKGILDRRDDWYIAHPHHATIYVAFAAHVGAHNCHRK